MDPLVGEYSQICYVVDDIEAAALRWTQLTGAGPWFLFEPEYSNRVYRGQAAHDRHLMALSHVGTTQIELYQPLDDEPSFVTELGQGLHHLAPSMQPLSGETWEAECRRYEGAGLEVALTCDIAGVGRCAFYDAVNELGCFLEVLELGEQYSMLPKLHALHHGWDGKEPLRSLDSLMA